MFALRDYTRFHIRLAATDRTVPTAMSKRSAIRCVRSPLATAVRIASTLDGDSFCARAGAKSASERPFFAACMQFCFGVHHSRFAAQLFSLLQSLWLTCAFGYGGGSRNAAATSRCTRQMRVDLLDRLARIYPTESGYVLSVLPRLIAGPFRICTSWSRLRTQPLSLTSYIPSYPATDFQCSIVSTS